MFHILRISLLVTVAACRTQNRTLGSSSILSFIALQGSFGILKQGLDILKIVTQNSVAKEVGCFPKMRSIQDFSLLIVGVV